MEEENRQVLDTGAFRGRVLSIARTRLDQLVTTLLDALFVLPGYTSSSYSGSDLEDLKSGVRFTAECFVGALSDERPLNEHERVALTVIGGRRAHLPREVLVSGITSACETGLDFLLDVAREVPAPAPVALAAVQSWRTDLARLREEATEALRTGQVKEQERMPSTRADDRVWLVDRLLFGLWDDPRELAREATRLACDLSPPMTLFLVVAASNTPLDGLKAVATELAALIPGATPGPARPVPSRPHVVVLAPRRTYSRQALLTDPLDNSARAASVHALSPDPADSLAALPSTYRRAVRDIALPSRLRLRPGVVTADELAYYRLLTRGDPAELADFAERFVGDLLRTKKAGQMIETLEAVHRCDGVPTAALALGVHENTVYYRLRKVTDLTGCDLGVPAEAERLYAGLRLRFAIQPDALAQAEVDVVEPSEGA